MKKHCRTWLSVVCGGIVAVSAVASAEIGDWKNYTDMSNVVGLVGARNAVWVGTSGGILRFTPADSTFQKFTNSEGLTGNDVSAIGLDSYGSVWIGEMSGAIDVYSPSANSWKYITDITLSLQTQKMINAFNANGDSMYIATAFGVSVFSISKFEFSDTYGNFGAFSHPNVTCMTILNGTLYVGTSSGMAISKPGVLNLADPESWNSYTIPSAVTAVTVFQGNVYAGSNSGVYVYQNGSWQPLPGMRQPVTALVSIDSVLYVAGQNNIYTLSSANTILPYGEAAPATITCAASDSSKRLFIGLQEAGIGILNTGTSQWAQLIANGPASSIFFSVEVDENGTVWAASSGPGGKNGTGFYSYDGTRWKNYNMATTPQLKTNEFFNVAIGPNNSKWIGAWGGPGGVGGGVAVVNSAGNIVRVFDNSDPGFVGTDPVTYVVTGNSAYDAAGNVWVPNFGSLNGYILWEMKPDSSWESIRSPASSSYNQVLGVTIDRNGTKWFVNTMPGFISTIIPHCVYYNETGAVSGLANDNWGEVTLADGLASTKVTCVAEDKEGSLWLGSDLGVTIIGDPADPTSQISIVYLGAVFGQFINTIAVDPLNNKWVAMQTGVIVLSPDGTSLIAQYNTANTNGKLVDNNVFSIAFDEKRGIAYFGTGKGLSSLEIPTIGTVEKMSTIQVGPNPFIIPDHPSVAIMGLADNTTIKILNVTGALVKEFAAQGGGRAFWDGTDSRGNSVGSGVYIIVAYADNGNQVATAKVAVLRR
ncbi:MAG: two-component regulator propeller domain-containing protein [Bacteroidota bacterium]